MVFLYCNYYYQQSSYLFLDADECAQRPCDPNAMCINFPGSFKCTCLNGFIGNGTFCQGTTVRVCRLFNVWVYLCVFYRELKHSYFPYSH